jgi:hypothetical protein
MCLSRVYKGKEKTETIKELEIRDDGYVWLWKVFGVNFDDTLTGQFKKHTFWDGKNTARHRIIRSLGNYREGRQYPSGFHCFTSKYAADKWRLNSNRDCALGASRITVPVKVKKSWIVAVGNQSNKETIVCKHIII